LASLERGLAQHGRTEKGQDAEPRTFAIPANESKIVLRPLFERVEPKTACHLYGRMVTPC